MEYMNIKKDYVTPSAEKIYIAKDTILRLSDNTSTATFDDGPTVGFDDF